MVLGILSSWRPGAAQAPSIFVAVLLLTALAVVRPAAAAEAALDAAAAVAEAARGTARGPALMRRSTSSSVASEHNGAHEAEEPLWEGVDETDLDEDLEDEVMMPRLSDAASLLADAGGGAGGSSTRLKRQRSSARHMELRTGSLEQQEATAEEVAAHRARLQVRASRLTVEGLEEEDPGDGFTASEAAAEVNQELLSEIGTSTTTTTGCFDRASNVAPIISMDGVPQECPKLKDFCEGIGDKSIYVALKCPLSCMVCEGFFIPEPVGAPRETHCLRRRRAGFCYSRRRRYGDSDEGPD